MEMYENWNLLSSWVVLVKMFVQVSFGGCVMKGNPMPAKLIWEVVIEIPGWIDSQITNMVWIRLHHPTSKW